MGSFDNLTVSRRLLIAFGALVALLLMVATTAWLRMGAMYEQTHQITSNWLPSVAHVNAMNTATSDLRLYTFQHVLNTDAAAMARIEEQMSGVTRELARHHDAYVKLVSSDAEQRMYEQFDAEWREYMRIHDNVLAHSRKNENVEAKALLEGESQRLFASSSELLVKLVALNQEGATASGEYADATFATARTVLLAASVLAALLAIALASLITRSLTQQLGGEPVQVMRFARAIAEGDLAPSLQPRSGDTNSIVAAMHGMCTRLNEIVSNVRCASDSVSAGTRQLSQGNDDLSQRTQEQAAAIEETAASMEQMTATVKQNSENARQANSLASTAQAQAERGGQVVANAISAMGEINASSSKIANIIGVIDEIAFQTNLLALNAAVEAARAGEQGRGFAVVASEVRNLAQRSATAAREIKSLITDSVEKVRVGSALVDESGSVLGGIVDEIKRVSHIVAEIASASEEQATGIDQVNTAMSQMDHTTQQNASLVEEAAAAAKSMEQQAQQMVQQVAFFKVHGASAIAPAPLRVVHSQPAVATANVTRQQSSMPSRPRTAARPVARVANGGASWQEF